MDISEEQLKLLEKATNEIKKYTQVVEICNLYRLRNEDPKGCLDMICNVVYGDRNG